MSQKLHHGSGIGFTRGLGSGSTTTTLRQHRQQDCTRHSSSGLNSRLTAKSTLARAVSTRSPKRNKQRSTSLSGSMLARNLALRTSIGKCSHIMPTTRSQQACFRRRLLAALRTATKGSQPTTPAGSPACLWPVCLPCSLCLLHLFKIRSAGCLCSAHFRTIFSVPHFPSCSLLTSV